MEKIETPRTSRSQRTRSAILDAAWRLLAEEGADALSMSAVAERAGISRRGLYLHFASRGELFVALHGYIDDVLDLESSVGPIREAPDAISALEAFVAHVVRYHVQLIPVARAVERARYKDPDAEELRRSAAAAWYSAANAVVARLADEGRLAAPWTVETATDLLWAFMSVEFIDDLATERGWDLNDFVERLRLVCRRTLVAETAV